MGQKDRDLYLYIADRIAQAEAGRPEALYDLGLLYSLGQGVEQDFAEAHKWFNLAAMKGLRRAAVDRSEVAKEMDHLAIESAQKEARRWLRGHPEQHQALM